MPKFLGIGQPIAVGVSRSISIQRPEVAELPFIGHRIPVGRKAKRTLLRNGDVIQCRLPGPLYANPAE